MYLNFTVLVLTYHVFEHVLVLTYHVFDYWHIMYLNFTVLVLTYHVFELYCFSIDISCIWTLLF